MALDYKKFVEDFEEWVHTQIQVMTSAQQTAERVYAENEEDMDAAVAMIRYESRVDAYRFLAMKFENFHKGLDFHDLPEEMQEGRTY